MRRERCLARLRDLRRPFVWVTAPAGTGKSHLLRQVVAERGRPAALVQLDPGARDPGTLGGELWRALQEVAPGAALPLFGADDSRYPRAYLRRLLEGALTALPDGVLLALDDFHHLDPAPALADALVASLADRVGPLRVLVASRSAPAPSWARLVTDGLMAELEPELLLMDEDEIRTLLERRSDWPHGSGPELVAAIRAASGGWPFGVGALIEVGCRRPAAVAPLPRDEARATVLDSLTRQIVDGLTAAERRRLLLLAPCRVLPADVVADVLGSEAALLLERLCRDHVLVERDPARVPGAAARYRMHDLLRDALRVRARIELRGDAAAAAASVLARALLRAGEDEAARDLLVAHAAWEELAGHLDEVAETMMGSGRGGALLRWLDTLPPVVREARPTLRYWRGLCLLPVDPSASRRELEAAYVTLRASGDGPSVIRAWSALVDALWFEWEDCTRLDPCIADLPALAVLPGLGELELALLSRGALAALSIRRADHPDLGLWEERAFALFQRRLSRPETVRRGLQLMIHYTYGSGERRKAELVRARLRQIHLADREWPPDHCVWYVVNAAFQFWFEADGRQAPATVVTGLAVTGRLGVPFWDVPMLNAALFRLAADEDLAGLRAMLAALEDRLGPASREHDLAIGQHFTAYRTWLEGDREAALLHIDAALRIAVRSGFCLSPVYYGIGKAAVLASCGRRRAALRELRLARRAAWRQCSRTLSFMALMVGAGLALRAGRDAAALLQLRPALALGAQERFHAVPWLRLADRAALCELAVARGVEPGYARTLRPLSAPQDDGPERPRLATLGRVDVLVAGRSRLTTAKPQVVPLLAMLHLVAAGPHGLGAERLIDRLWPDTDTATGRHRLKTTLHRLRRLLGDPQAVATAGGTVRLDPDRVVVDVWEILDPPADADPVATAQRMLDLHHGPFVDLYSGHVDLLVLRERLVAAVETAVLAAANACCARAQPERAAALLERAIDRLGLQERLVEALAACLGRSGRKEALRRLRERWSVEMT